MCLKTATTKSISGYWHDTQAAEQSAEKIKKIMKNADLL